MIIGASKFIDCIREYTPKINRVMINLFKLVVLLANFTAIESVVSFLVMI